MASIRKKPNMSAKNASAHHKGTKNKANKRRDDRRARPVEKPAEESGDAPAIGTIQWFPGHMARTRRKIQESLKLVDAVVEIVDARIPLSSRNPEMDSLTKGKPRMIILNKADLADESANRRWLTYFKKQGMAAIAVDFLLYLII